MKVTPGGILAPYKGLNVLLLNLFSQDGAMRSSVWGTFKSLLKTLGHPVQKGQKASGTIVWVGKVLVSKKESEETPKDDD
jgi:antirestriction protein ArdC